MKQPLEERVVQAAERALADHQYVSAIDLLTRIGWLQPVHVLDWRKGSVPYLEQVIHVNLSKLSHAMKVFRNWAENRGLKPSETAYLARTRGTKRELQFSASGDPAIEKTYRTHYVSPEPSEKKRERLQERLSRPPELVVFSILRESQCSKCKTGLEPGSFLYMEADAPLCLTCAQLDELTFLPSGDARLSRLAKKYSQKSAVVVRFSRSRKRYERQGILVEETALQKAQDECADVTR